MKQKGNCYVVNKHVLPTESWAIEIIYTSIWISMILSLKNEIKHWAQYSVFCISSLVVIADEFWINPKAVWSNFQYEKHTHTGNDTLNFKQRENNSWHYKAYNLKESNGSARLSMLLLLVAYKIVDDQSLLISWSDSDPCAWTHFCFEMEHTIHFLVLLPVSFSISRG